MADQQAQRARDLDVPDQMTGAQRHLTTVLDFRAEALAVVADQIRAALGSARAAEDATNEIAGQMQKLLASDVVYSQRVAPLIKQELDDNDITGQTIASSKFLPNLGWLDPGTVATRIGGEGGGATQPPGARPARPRPHLDVSVGDTDPAAAARGQPAGRRLGHDVRRRPSRTRAHNDESNVKVTVTISGAGKPITVNKTVRPDEGRRGGRGPRSRSGSRRRSARP